MAKERDGSKAGHLIPSQIALRQYPDACCQQHTHSLGWCGERDPPHIAPYPNIFERIEKKESTITHKATHRQEMTLRIYIYYMDRNYIQYILEHLKKKGAYMYQGSRNI